MLASLPGFLENYGMYLAGLAVVCAVASYFSKNFFKQLKKGLLLVAVLFALVAGYELITGHSIFTLPGRIDKQLSEAPENPETGHRYYKNYDERYGEDPTKGK